MLCVCMGHRRGCMYGLVHFGLQRKPLFIIPLFILLLEIVYLRHYLLILDVIDKSLQSHICLPLLILYVDSQLQCSRSNASIRHLLKKT